MPSNFTKIPFRHEDVTTTAYSIGTGPSLVFLHGGGVRALAYRPVLLALSQHFHVIAPDLPGFGSASAPPHPWDLYEYGKYVSSFIDKLHTEVIVVGHSLGGGIGIALAHNPKVKGLILIDSTGIPSPHSDKHFKKELMFKKFFRNIYLYPTKQYTYLVGVKDFFVNTLKKRRHAKVVIASVTKCLQTRFTHLNQITIPTIILWGTHDELFPVENARILHTEITNSQLVLIPGNHDWIIAKPEEVVKAAIKLKQNI